MKKSIWITAVLLVSVVPMAAQTTSNQQVLRDITRERQQTFLPWLSKTTAQTAVFNYLRTKTTVVPVKPTVPKNGLMKWATSRYADVSNDRNKLYGFILEDLVVAKDLLQESDIQQKKRGLRLVTQANLFVYSLLDDHQLNSQIYQAFILPYLHVASDKRWEDLSIQRLVEGASNSFKRSADVEKQITVLRLLLTLHTSQNTRDWARAEIAQALASRGRYREAVLYLRQIESKGWEPIKSLIPDYEQKANTGSPS